jgi:hypothetical protein
MLSLNVVPREDRPLTDQIVMGVKRQIDDRQLRPGRELQRRHSAGGVGGLRARAMCVPGSLAARSRLTQSLT